jgi:hypothetical protein
MDGWTDVEGYVSLNISGSEPPSLARTSPIWGPWPHLPNRAQPFLGLQHAPCPISSGPPPRAALPEFHILLRVSVVVVDLALQQQWCVCTHPLHIYIHTYSRRRTMRTKRYICRVQRRGAKEDPVPGGRERERREKARRGEERRGEERRGEERRGEERRGEENMTSVYVLTACMFVRKGD